MKRVLTTILALLIIALIGYYAYDVALKHTPFEENLPKVLGGVIVLLISLIRLQMRMGKPTKKRKDLAFYEKSYEAEIGTAFYNKPKHKKKLLEAIRFFNEDNYGKAMKYLQALTKVCKTDDDAKVVMLFLGLCFSDMQLCDHAIAVYERLVQIAPNNASYQNNLGMEYMQKGNYEKAMSCFKTAVSADGSYAQAYHNTATCLFHMGELQEAAEYAEKALDLKKNLHQASSLLAIIYALLEEPEKQKKYFHLAISTGKSAEDIQAAIAHYLAEKEAMQEEPDGEQ